MGLPLCALGSGAVHGLCVVVLLPMIMLSGPRAKVDTIAIEVDVVTMLPPSASSPAGDGDAAPAETETSFGADTEAASADVAISADETDRTSALPASAQESEPPTRGPSALVEDASAVIEPAVTAPQTPPSVANFEQPTTTRPESAEIKIGVPDADVPAEAAEPEKATPKKAELKQAGPQKAAPKKAAPKKAAPKKAEPKKATLKKAAPKKTAAAKPKPPARRTKVQRTPGTVTSSIQNLFKNLSKGRLSSKPTRARSRSGTGSKSAPAGKGNKANPLYFR